MPTILRQPESRRAMRPHGPCSGPRPILSSCRRPRRAARDWYYLDRSQRGDITGIRNDSGTLQATIRYTAYGEVWTDNQTLVDKLALTYNGRDSVVSMGGGLYWMGYRVYSATQGRFVGADPMEATTGTMASAYNYADGDPVNQIDPTGERSLRGCHWFLSPPRLRSFSASWIQVRAYMLFKGCWGGAIPMRAQVCLAGPNGVRMLGGRRRNCQTMHGYQRYQWADLAYKNFAFTAWRKGIYSSRRWRVISFMSFGNAEAYAFNPGSVIPVTFGAGFNAKGRGFPYYPQHW